MTASSLATSLRRPVLAPGLRVVATPRGDVQIGLGPRHRLRLADSPALRRVLEVLARGETVADAPASRRVLRELAPVLRDGDALQHPQLPDAEVAAAALRHRDAAVRLLRRSAHRVRVVGDLGLAPALDPTTLLERCGLHAATADERPTVALVLTCGEPDRDALDPWLVEGVPYLLVRVIEGDVVVGPFVGPGTTACLRCVDAHVAESDRAGARLLHDYWRGHRHDGVADPVDTATAVAALGFAVGDLVRYAERDEPLTWSATVALAADGPPGRVVTWLRHQDCGCSWISSDGWTIPDRRSDTMEA